MNIILYLAGLFGFLWLICALGTEDRKKGILGGTLPLSDAGSGQHAYAPRSVAVMQCGGDNGERVPAVRADHDYKADQKRN